MSNTHGSEESARRVNWKGKYFEALGVSYFATCIALLGAWLKTEGWVKAVDIGFAAAFFIGAILVLLFRNRIPEHAKNRMTSVRTNHFPIFIGLVLLGVNLIAKGDVMWGIIAIYIAYATLLFVILAQLWILVTDKGRRKVSRG
jgi:hypothetical protein